MTYHSGFAAIIGRPNVGKSTLMNHLLGQKLAIMSDKAQTTRNKIRCVLTREDAQVVFIDTPGIHKPKHRLGEILVETATSALREVDVILFLVEATSDPGPGDQYIMDMLQQVKTPVFLVINKVDLVNKEALLPLIAKYQQKMEFAQVIPLSALQGENTDSLVQALVAELPEGPQYYPADMVTDHPERFIMGELIREKVLHLTSEEIPHSVAVEIEEVKERDNGKVYVAATIYVERDSQKGILVGKNGSMSKKIGQLARSDIENLLGSKVYLDLWVKVKKDWRNREGVLKGFGYDPNLE
ncbi:MAG TPA: GTPase Era [Bacillota bacterium]|nr:GTPase Era [Bacillota bacterium]